MDLIQPFICHAKEYITMQNQQDNLNWNKAWTYEEMNNELVINTFCCCCFQVEDEVSVRSVLWTSSITALDVFNWYQFSNLYK